MDHLCNLCLVFAMLSRLSIAALWSPEGKGIASWFLFVNSGFPQTIESKIPCLFLDFSLTIFKFP